MSVRGCEQFPTDFASLLCQALLYEMDISFFWSTDFKVQSPARYVMRVPFTAQRVDSVPSFQKKRVEVAPISSESVGLHRAAPPQQSSVNLLDKQNQANSAKFRNAQGDCTYNIPERSDLRNPSTCVRTCMSSSDSHVVSTTASTDVVC